ncbi:F-box domain-containing protein [Balamuthia mandrillaris]
MEREEEGEETEFFLPPELWSRVFGYVAEDYADVCACFQVCRHWQSLLRHEVSEVALDSTFHASSSIVVLAAARHGPGLRYLRFSAKAMDAPQLCQSLLSLSLPRLHTLELAGCASRFPPSVLGSLLRSLPQLSCLSLEGCKGVMKLGLLPIERSEGELPAEHLSSLCSLNLKGCPFVNNATLLEIAHCCPSLTSLSLAVCHRITDVGLYGLAGLIHDDVINVYAARDEEATSGTTRQVLPPRKIKGVPLLPKNTALVPPVGCRKLETLDLRGCFALSSHGLATCLAHQNRFPSLRCLNLGGNPNVDRHFMEALFGHEGQERPTLTSLSLRQCQRMTNRALAYLCNSAASCALVTLDLWACDKVTDILWTIHKLATHLTSLSKPYREVCSCFVALFP